MTSGVISKPGPTLVFDRGTLLLKDMSAELVERVFGPGYFQHDPRVNCFRCDALRYHEVRSLLREQFRHGYSDQSMKIQPLRWKHKELHQLRKDQEEALFAWRDAGGRGVIVLPTGAGKTEVALHAIPRMEKPTLVVVPIRDLMYQWHRRILSSLGYDAGIVGDNLYNLKPVTVTTYHSAAIHGGEMGDRFQLIIFDEVHHLPGTFFREGALCSAAPFRMGLTATLERPNGKHADLDYLVGKVVFVQKISEAKGKTLADYDVIRIPVALSPEEQEKYDQYSRMVREFVAARRKENPLFRWEDALAESGKEPEARKAKIAYFAKQKLENEAFEKFRVLEDIFRLHAGERALVFSGSNPMAVKISKRFLIPALLSHSGKKERLEILRGFESGRFPALVANRVLDEGVDVPSVKVAVVVGGLASTRQAKQRLGRILRRTGDAKGILYEVVCEASGEQMRSRLRRRSDAFERTRHRTF